MNTKCFYFSQQEVQLQGRHLEPRNHLNRNDERGTALHEWVTRSSSVPDHYARQTADWEFAEILKRTEFLSWLLSWGECWTSSDCSGALDSSVYGESGKLVESPTEYNHRSAS